MGCFPIGGANLFRTAGVLVAACGVEEGTDATVAGVASIAAFAAALETLFFFFVFRLPPVLL